MKRRNFLATLTIAPLALVVKPVKKRINPHVTLQLANGTEVQFKDYTDKYNEAFECHGTGYLYTEKPISRELFEKMMKGPRG